MVEIIIFQRLKRISQSNIKIEQKKNIFEIYVHKYIFVINKYIYIYIYIMKIYSLLY